MSLKKQTLASMIISLIIGVILGTLILLLAGIVDASFIIKWTLIIMGIITIISNIPSLVTGIMNIKAVSGIVNLVMSILGIVLGAMMIFMQNEIITTILAVYLIAFPIVSIILSKDWRNAIKSEWLKILIGVLLIVFLPAIIGAADTIFNILLTVAGWVTIGISVLLFVLSLVAFLKATKKAQNTAPDVTETTAEETEEN
ncbi:MAG: hypothetical protein E7611_05335 [Ruminococcaceae bacterium]|nr:hypothetical protein [Oscillospiraceae bacterium]